MLAPQMDSVCLSGVVFFIFAFIQRYLFKSHPHEDGLLFLAFTVCVLVNVHAGLVGETETLAFHHPYFE